MELFLIAFAMLAVSYIITSLLTPKPETPKPASLEEWDFPKADDGTPQGVLFGDGWTPGMVAWYGNYVTKKIKAGGKK